MPWLLIGLATWTLSIWLIWRLVKTGADEDARRAELRKHLEDVA